MSDSRRERARQIRSLLATEGANVAANTKEFNEGRYDAVAELAEYDDLKAEARAIKEAAIDDLPSLIDVLTTSIESNGGQVHQADDAAAARSIVRDIVDGVGGETVVKSKSMTTEELDINAALAEDGVDVWETDLGEFVVQLADEQPSHIVAPAIHRSREDIAELFATAFDLENPPESAAELTAFAREFLGDRMAEADVGMTGANFLLAESGSLALVTSEGNARKTIADTDVHIAVAGVEKIIPSLDELDPFIELLARSSTGQALTSYLTLLTPPGDTPSLAEDTTLSTGTTDRTFHLVLVDNGRMNLREDPELRETLYCIRCSACLNSCANFQQVGGHAFGGETYSGGIGTAWEAGIESLESAGSFGDLCTGCSRCVNQCPVNIDIPWLNEVIRDRVNHSTDDGAFDWVHQGLMPDVESGRIDLPKRVFGNIEAVAKLGSATAPLSNWVTNRSVVRAALDRWVGIDRRRQLPTFERETFTEWFTKRGPAVSQPSAQRTAVLYPDVYTNYIDVARGKAAVRALEAYDVHIHVPAAPESGRAPLSQGMLTTARQQAQDTVQILCDAALHDMDVVVIEPSDLAMFRRDYDRLLEANPLAEQSYDLLEYMYGLETNHEGPMPLAGPAAVGYEGIAYHSHCQQRTLGLEAHTEAVLEAAGFDVATSSVECCGMAGSFGYKSEYYELSMAVAADLADQLETTEMQNRHIVASGTSCLDQLEAVMHRNPSHPIEVLDPAQAG